MNSRKSFVRAAVGAAVLAPSVALAQGMDVSIRSGLGLGAGFSAVWVFANLLYAGQVAQDRAHLAWRVVLFVLGFPGTLLTTLFVEPGSQRVFGVELPVAGGEPADGSEDTGNERGASGRSERESSKRALVALMVGFGLVFLLAPTTRFAHVPAEDGTTIATKTTQWGWSLTPWLAYERTGTGRWPEVEWERGEWIVQPTPEAVLTLLAVIALLGWTAVASRRRPPGPSERERPEAGSG